MVDRLTGQKTIRSMVDGLKVGSADPVGEVTRMWKSQWSSWAR
jgi:hypothetical protein